jgi:hypothetical protein
MRHETHDEVVRLSFPSQLIADVSELLTVWELEVVEEVDDLLEGRVRREIVDVVADVGESTFFPIDVGDGGLGRYDTFEALSWFAGHAPMRPF